MVGVPVCPIGTSRAPAGYCVTGEHAEWACCALLNVTSTRAGGRILAKSWMARKCRGGFVFDRPGLPRVDGASLLRTMGQPVASLGDLQVGHRAFPAAPSRDAMCPSFSSNGEQRLT
jgi:hypothetical protein